MNLLKLIGLTGLDLKDVIQNVFHNLSPQLAKPVLEDFFVNRVSAEGAAKIGRLLVMAGEKLQAGDKKGAAGDFARVVGEIKF